MNVFKFFKKNILIISPEPWDYIKVSKHHYAQTLAAKNNLVCFLNPPDKNVDDITSKKVADNLLVVDYKNPYNGARFLPKAVRKFLNRKLFNKIQSAIKVNFDVVILFENSRFYDLDFLPRDVLSIYFQVDEDQNFHPSHAAKSADLALSINDVIQKILCKFRQTVFKIPHGFSGSFSEEALHFYYSNKTYRKTGKRIKAYYVGNLDHNFSDTSLIAALVSKKQDVDFIFIGPYSTSGKLYGLIKNCSNVQFHGKVPANTIPKLLDEADVLFFVYTEHFLSSSHKVMEYLASGKAIVTTTVKGYPEDPELFYCSKTREKFIDLFTEVCASIEEANSPDKMKKRIQFAIENTYESRIKQIEELVGQVLNNKPK